MGFSSRLSEKSLFSTNISISFYYQEIINLG